MLLSHSLYSGHTFCQIQSFQFSHLPLVIHYTESSMSLQFSIVFVGTFFLLLFLLVGSLPFFFLLYFFCLLMTESLIAGPVFTASSQFCLGRALLLLLQIDTG